MVELYAQRASELADDAVGSNTKAALSHPTRKEHNFYAYLLENDVREFRPVDLAGELGVTNRTIINWSGALSRVGLLEPQVVRQRVTSYRRVDSTHNLR